MSYYFREAIGYLPVVMLWICCLYLLSIKLFLSAVIDLYNPERQWLRRPVYAIVFVSFFFCMFVGGTNLVGESRGVQRMGEANELVLFGLPLLIGSATAARYLAGLGDDVRKEFVERDVNRGY